MTPAFNYRHLHYFWVVAREGGMSRAAARLCMSVQAVSTQVRELERDLGCALFKPAGRGLALTEAGEVALRQADQIFQLGELLPAAVRDAASTPAVRLAVGIPDGLPKLAVRHLLEPVIGHERLRLLCHDGEFEDLLGELALHKLDLVISDRPAPQQAGLRLHSHLLGASPIAWYAAPALARRVRQLAAHDAREGDGIKASGRPQRSESAGSRHTHLPPQALARALAHDEVAVLLPTGHGVLRSQIDQWFDRHGLRARMAGEFEDSALLKTFGASGLGVFPAATMVEADMVRAYGVERLGPCEGATEQFYAVTIQKKVEHALVRRVIESAAFQG